jgi:hypothetical protein
MFRITTAALVPLAAALCWPSHAWADDPPNQDIRFQIHTDPGDADSPVFMRYDLHLIPWKVDGNTVSWLASTVHISRLSSGSVVESWTQSDVAFSTSDGFWTVAHYDASQPVIGEFLLPPLLSSTAANDNVSGPSLAYSLEATGNTTNRTHPYTNTAFLNHSALRSGDTSAIDDGSDEPTDGQAE